MRDAILWYREKVRYRGRDSVESYRRWDHIWANSAQMHSYALEAWDLREFYLQVIPIRVGTAAGRTQSWRRKKNDPRPYSVRAEPERPGVASSLSATSRRGALTWGKRKRQRITQGMFLPLHVYPVDTFRHFCADTCALECCTREMRGCSPPSSLRVVRYYRPPSGDVCVRTQDCGAIQFTRNLNFFPGLCRQVGQTATFSEPPTQPPVHSVSQD